MAVIRGDDSDNTLTGSSPEDTVLGGGGADTITDTGGGLSLAGEAGDDLISSRTPGAILDGGSGDDRISFTGDSNGPGVWINGGDGADVITFLGVTGDVLAAGGAGRDTFKLTTPYRRGPTILDFQAGPGGDVIDGTGLYREFETPQLYWRQAGPDTILWAGSIVAGEPDFPLITLKNVAITDLTPANLIRLEPPRLEILLGTPGDDALTGNDFKNRIAGDAGDDVLHGLGGDDILDGSKGADTLYGGQGADTYYVDSRQDRVVEAAGEGIDIVFAGFGYVLSDNVENLTLLYNDDISGTGNALGNRITGNGGDNLLKGMGGADILEGGDGDDILIGGSGADFLMGGFGRDTYIYNSVAEIGNGGETISDDADSVIDLSAIDADTTQAGNQTFSWIGESYFHRTPGELRLFAGDPRIVQGDVNGDGVADFTLNLLFEYVTPEMFLL